MATGPHEPSTSHERVLLTFFALTFAITWGCWVPLAVGVALHSIPGRALGYAGTFAPALVALALAFKRARAAGVRELLARLQPRAVAARWVAFALGFTIAVKLAAALLHRAITGAWPAFGSEPFWLMALGTLVSTPVQAGEELGWRGVALPHLATRLGLARASLLLGVVWALWHLPLFFVRGADSYGQSFPLYAIGVVAISAAIAMLYARTSGGLLLPTLFHAAVNNTTGIVPTASPGAHAVFSLRAPLIAWLTAAVLWACTAPILMWMVRTEPQRTGTYEP